MNVFDLAAKITLDTSEYDKNLDSSETKANKFGTVMANVGKASAAALSAIATGAVAVGKEFYNEAKAIAEYGDNIDKMSQKIGISAEAYQEWDAILQHCGASVDSLQPSMKTLATQAQKGSDAFEKLGIAQEDVAKLSTEDLFAKVVSGLQEMEEGTERTYIASQLLGRGATELAGLFNTTAEDTETMRQRVHELGGVMSNEAVKSAAAYQDTLQDMTTAFDGIKRSLFSGFMPAITEVMQGITMIFSDDGDGGIAKISDGLSSFISQMSNTAVQISEKGGKIILSLVSAISNNLPKLLKAGANIVLMLARGIMAQLPEIIMTAFSVVNDLVIGIGEALPELIPAAVGIIMTLIEQITSPESLGKFVDATLAITVGLVNGLIDAIPVLLKAVPVIISNLVQAIVENLPKINTAALEITNALAEMLTDPETLEIIIMAAVDIIEALIKGIAQLLPTLALMAVDIVNALASSIGNSVGMLKDKGQDVVNRIKDGIFSKIQDAKNWGKDLIDNFIGGITEKWNNLKNTVSNVAGTIKDFLGFSEPEKGPLSDFHTYAPDMMKLYAEGIRDNVDIVEDQLNRSLDFDFQNGAGMQRQSAGSTSKNLTIVLEVDKQRFAKAVVDLGRLEEQRQGTVLFSV